MGLLSAARESKSRDKDFTKKKRRVGKTGPDATTATKTTVSSKSLVMPQQALRSQQDSTTDVAQLRDILEKITHHSGNVRSDTFVKLNQLFQRKPEIMIDYIQQLLPHFGEAMSDIDNSVRSSVTTLLYAHLPSIIPTRMSPFFDIFLQYILAALNNITPTIRDDAIHYLRLVVVLYPSLLATHALTLLVNLSSLLSEKEVFMSKSGPGVKNYQFPHQFIHCKLQYWKLIYERVVNNSNKHTNTTNPESDSDFVSSSSSLSTHQQTLYEINEQLELKYNGKNNYSPFLDIEHQTDLCDSSLLQLPNGAILSNTQTLLFTIQVVLKYSLSTNTATLASCLYQSQLTNPMKLPNIVSSPNMNNNTNSNTNNNNNNNGNINTNTNTNNTIQQTPNHLRLLSPLYQQITYDTSLSVRDELTQSISTLQTHPINQNITLSPHTIATSTSSTTSTSKTTTTSSNLKTADLDLIYTAQQTTRLSSTRNNNSILILQLQPILHTTLKSLLTCWDTYAPPEWSHRAINDHDIYEKNDLQSTFAQHQLGSKHSSSQRHMGKLKKSKENNNNINNTNNNNNSNNGTNNTNIQPQQLLHAYSILVSIVASTYYLSHLDLQCRSLHFNNDMNKSTYYRGLSLARLSKGLTLLLPFNDIPSFNLLHISSLQYFPFTTDEPIHFNILSELNLWTCRLISLILPCIPSSLTSTTIMDTLLQYQQLSLQKRFHEIKQLYYHVKTQTQQYLNEHGLELNKAMLQQKMEKEESEYLMAKFNPNYKNKKNNDKNNKNNKNGHKNNNNNKNNNKNNKNNDENSPDEYILPNDTTYDIDSVPLFIEYKDIYKKYHKQIAAIELYKKTLSKPNEELYKQSCLIYDTARIIEQKLYHFIINAVNIYSQQDAYYYQQHQLRLNKVTNNTIATSSNNKNVQDSKGSTMNDIKKQSNVIETANTPSKTPIKRSYQSISTQNDKSKPKTIKNDFSLLNNDEDNEDDEDSENDEDEDQQDEDNELEVIEQDLNNDNIDQLPLSLPSNNQLDIFLTESNAIDTIEFNTQSQSTINDTTMNDDELELQSSFHNIKCLPTFRDFLDLFWQILPSFTSDMKYNLVSKYTQFYLSLSTEPLSTMKVLAVLPLLLLPQTEYDGSFWHEHQLITTWLDSFVPLIQSSLRVATLQRGAWLLSGGQGHKLLKVINWEFILTSINTSLSYIALKYNNDIDTRTITTPTINEESSKMIDAKTQLALPTTPTHSNASLITLLLQPITKSTHTQSHLLHHYQFGPILHALYWSSIQLSTTSITQPISISFYQSFTTLLCTHLLSQTNLHQLTPETVAFIVATQLKFQTLPQISTTSTENNTNTTNKSLIGPAPPPSSSTTTTTTTTNTDASTTNNFIITNSQSICGLSTQSSQYLQDIMLLHPQLTSKQQLEFLFTSILSQEFILDQPSLLKTTSTATTLSNPSQVTIFALNDNQEIIINFILHVLQVYTTASNDDIEQSTTNTTTTIKPSTFIDNVFIPTITTFIEEFYQMNFTTENQQLLLTSLNATKLMQLLFILYTFSLQHESRQELSLQLKPIVMKFFIWYTIIGFSIQHNQLLDNITIGPNSNKDQDDNATSTTSTTSLKSNKVSDSKSTESTSLSKLTTSMNDDDTNTSDYLRYVNKFHQVKKQQIVKSQYYGLHSSLVTSFQRILPYLLPLTYDSNHNNVINSFRQYNQYTIQFTTHVLQDVHLFGGQFALTLFAPGLLGLDKLVINGQQLEFFYNFFTTILILISKLTSLSPTIISNEDLTTLSSIPFIQSLLNTIFIAQIDLDTIFTLLSTLLSIAPIQSTYLQISEQQDDQSFEYGVIHINKIIVQICEFGAISQSTTLSTKLSSPIFNSFCTSMKNFNSLLPKPIEFDFEQQDE